MRRWNGWGDTATSYPLPESAADYLVQQIGPSDPSRDAEFEHLLKTVPASRLPDHPLIDRTPETRLLHARGQSLPDWLELRTGRVSSFPDGVAFPQDETQVAELLALVRKQAISLIPYGGGTSVVGHINPLPGERPVLTLDLSHLNRLTVFDETSRLATFGAGTTGPALETQLRERGYTLGHFPQSHELSTLGGWIATRSSGQQSYYYGRIEDLFAGGHLETLDGPFDLPLLPASAAGPDLRQLVLGSEGRLGVITSATVRVRRLPERDGFYGIIFRDWESGAACLRAIAQAGLQVSMLRLSDAQETETNLALSGKESLVALAQRGLGLLGYNRLRCLLIYGLTGSLSATRLAQSQLNHLARHYGGLPTGALIGKIWRKSRFLTPYLRNTLWERGVMVDTLESALPWSQVLPTAVDCKASLQQALSTFGERALVFAHLSHIYPDGASFYITYLFRQASDPDETLARWQAMKAAASRLIVARGGTISHQHGVGLDHAAYLPVEKGPAGMRLLAAACRELDPQGLLNPGKLLALLPEEA
jgi:alkyldihydroxyacetonephosphate synthase